MEGNRKADIGGSRERRGEATEKGLVRSTEETERTGFTRSTEITETARTTLAVTVLLARPPEAGEKMALQ